VAQLMVSNLVNFFEKAALNDINDENATEAINSIFNKYVKIQIHCFQLLIPLLFIIKK
jgi:hypothetical protein